MTLSLRRGLAAVAATAALIALAGCGGDDSDGAADKPVAVDSSTPGSADATAEASEDSGQDSGEDSGGGSAPATGAELSGGEFADILEKALDEATTAHIAMDLGGQGSAKGDADYTTTPPELSVTMDMAALGGQIEVRMVDGTIYMKSASLGSDQWIAFPLDDPNSPLGDLGAQLDPAQQFETFANAVTTATYDGSQDLDGESLEHYTATVDTAKLLEQLNTAGQAGQLPDTLQQEWWFDADGRIRQMRTAMGPLGDVSVSLTDWGTDVDIEAPPSDEVTSLPGTGTS